jgi:hypothetical protein
MQMKHKNKMWKSRVISWNYSYVSGVFRNTTNETRLSRTNYIGMYAVLKFTSFTHRFLILCKYLIILLLIVQDIPLFAFFLLLEDSIWFLRRTSPISFRFFWTSVFSDYCIIRSDLGSEMIINIEITRLRCFL